MSHKQAISVCVDDRDSLIDAIKEMGYEVNEQKQDLRAFDFTIKSDLSIKKDGRQLMIGFMQQEDGTFKLEADFYGTGIDQKKFQQEINMLHGKHKVARWFEQNRYTTRYEVDEDGDLVVVGERWH